LLAIFQPTFDHLRMCNDYAREIEIARFIKFTREA
jgi:hypothetical protein